MVIRTGSPGLGYVLLHHRPIRGLESQCSWWCVKQHKVSECCLLAHKEPEQWCDIAFDPVEICWQASVSCNHQSYQSAGARIRDDISIHQCDGSHREDRLYKVSGPLGANCRVRFSVLCALCPFWSKYPKDEQHAEWKNTWFNKQA